MKILQVGKFYPPYKGGMESHLQLLCRELKPFVDVKVIVANTASNTEKTEMDGIDVIRVARSCQVAGAPICRTMAKEIRSLPADVIHIHLPNPTALLAYLASGHRGRLILTYHSDTIRQRVLTRMFDPVLEQCIHRASAVICASPNIIDHSAVLSRWKERCLVVPFGIDSRLFERDYSTDVEAIQLRFGRRIILSVGRLVYYKGFEYVIEAMAKVDAHLLIVGEGPLLQKLTRQIQHSGLVERVTILGGIQEIGPFYQAAKIFVLPAVERTEAFGLVQLEAMASGLPVVNTSVESGVPFVSLHKVTGLTVSPRDPEGLANAINLILENEPWANSLGAASKQRAALDFSLRQMISRTLKVYEDATVSSNKTLGKHAPTFGD